MEGTRVPLTQHLICLAVVEALDSLAQAQAESVGERLDDSGFRIKWPNDVYHGSLKVGGVLVESSLRATGEFTVVFGVGLNLSNTAPTTCVKDILERLPGGGAATAVTREVVMAEALSRLEDMLRELGSEGFAALRERYLRRWMHGGQEVAIDFGDGRTGSAVVESIDMNGYMVSQNECGEHRHVKLCYGEDKLGRKAVTSFAVRPCHIALPFRHWAEDRWECTCVSHATDRRWTRAGRAAQERRVCHAQSRHDSAGPLEGCHQDAPIIGCLRQHVLQCFQRSRTLAIRNTCQWRTADLFNHTALVMPASALLWIASPGLHYHTSSLMTHFVFFWGTVPRIEWS